MENEMNFIKTDVFKTGKMIISSKAIKYSKLELAWRIGITVAVVVLICLSV
ncbi:hypothetical protein [Bacteroides sp.]|uniref:hypothetical protein n=1 Tax=Bacteroides sp. TaxID=29523 RepID=UPI00260D9A73|nr:hypothetical protein [Bacteroides sp.]